MSEREKEKKQNNVFDRGAHGCEIYNGEREIETQKESDRREGKRVREREGRGGRGERERERESKRGV